MMVREGDYLLETPENVELTFELAGPGSRFCALLIDYLLMWVIVFVIGVLAGIAGLFDALDHRHAESEDGWSNWMFAALIAAVALILFGYGFFFEFLMGGQTPGKRGLKLRVLRDDGTPASAIDLAIRNLIRIVDFLPAFYALGGFVALLSTQQKRLGDMAAGTIVVKEGIEDYRAMADKKKPAQTAEPLAIANVALNPEELRLIRGFLQRREELLPEARLHLAEQLGRRLHAKYGGVYEGGEQYLQRLAEGRHYEP